MLTIALILIYGVGVYGIHIFCRSELHAVTARIEAERAERAWQARLATVVAESDNRLETEKGDVR